MKFSSKDKGPFYLQHPSTHKYPKDTGKRKKRNKTKEEILVELKKKGDFTITHYMTTKQVSALAVTKSITLTKNEKVIEPGWMGEPKGMLQVLFERGYIDTNRLKMYSEKGLKDHHDSTTGKLMKDYEQFSLRKLMEQQVDFINEPSAMEKLFTTLFQQGPQTIYLLTSPNYHCEIVGEGVEYCWGLTKRYFRKILLSNKNTKEKFNDMVTETMHSIKKEHVRRFA